MQFLRDSASPLRTQDSRYSYNSSRSILLLLRTWHLSINLFNPHIEEEVESLEEEHVVEEVGVFDSAGGSTIAIRPLTCPAYTSALTITLTTNSSTKRSLNHTSQSVSSRRYLTSCICRPVTLIDCLIRVVTSITSYKPQKARTQSTNVTCPINNRSSSSGRITTDG
jgi:hypothetical protein